MTNGRLPEVITALARIGRDGPGTDGLQIFAQLYGQTMELIDERIGGEFFVDPDFVERLAVHTAVPFLEAIRQVETDERVSPAWRPLANSRRNAGLQPVQFVLAGINAQLHHDAPVALVRTCEEAKVSPYRPDIERDFGQFCVLLVELAQALRAGYLTDGSAGDRRSSLSMVELISRFSISRGQRTAWVNGLTLWQIASIDALARPFERGLAHTTGLIGGQLLIGVVDQLEVTQPLTEEMLFGL